jgi:VIT1/CCC1 family predicted Fe2+/Mn2+ transporter
VTEAGREDVRSMLAAALGCNLAWGLVDAVMYLVRTVAERGRLITLVRSVQSAPDAAAGHAIIKNSLSKVAAGLLSEPEIEAVRGRVLALTPVPERPTLKSDDYVAALAVFLLVVASTFPVVLPFVFIQDVGTAKALSRAIALVMLFLGGLALGRYAGYGSWKAGLMMTGLGAVVVAAVMALGG